MSTIGMVCDLRLLYLHYFWMWFFLGCNVSQKWRQLVKHNTKCKGSWFNNTQQTKSFVFVQTVPILYMPTHLLNMHEYTIIHRYAWVYNHTQVCMSIQSYTGMHEYAWVNTVYGVCTCNMKIHVYIQVVYRVYNLIPRPPLFCFSVCIQYNTWRGRQWKTGKAWSHSLCEWHELDVEGWADIQICNESTSKASFLPV